jgi:hypothetical protein
MVRMSDADLKAWGRKLRKLRAEKPAGVRWQQHVKEHAGIGSRRADLLIAFANGTLKITEYRAKQLEARREHSRNHPLWVRTNIQHVDPRVTMGVIRFLIERSVRILRGHCPDAVPDFLNDLRAIINDLEISHQLKGAYHDHVKTNGKVAYAARSCAGR